MYTARDDRRSTNIRYQMDCVESNLDEQMGFTPWLYYCAASQEWQWRRVLFTIVKLKSTCTLNLSLCESIDHLCINPIHEW